MHLYPDCLSPCSRARGQRGRCRGRDRQVGFDENALPPACLELTTTPRRPHQKLVWGWQSWAQGWFHTRCPELGLERVTGGCGEGHMAGLWLTLGQYEGSVDRGRKHLRSPG